MSPESRDRILVAGANGMLGSAIARKVLAVGWPLRALSRDAVKLARLGELGAEVIAADMLDRAAMERASEGVAQVVSTANNLLGRGAQSCRRIDEPMYSTLGASAKAAGVDRWIHISARNIGPDSTVDYFRLKHRVESIVRDSRVPWVIVRPSAFMDVWTGVLFGNLDQPSSVATIFGRGHRAMNYIAIEDVASFVLAILRDTSIRNEIIEIGGPSENTFVEFTNIIQQAMGVPARRKHVPAPLLGIARHVVRPFNEVAARLASLGHWTTLANRPFPEWQESARRLGVRPVTIEQFAERFVKHRS